MKLSPSPPSISYMSSPVLLKGSLLRPSRGLPNLPKTSISSLSQCLSPFSLTSLSFTTRLTSRSPVTPTTRSRTLHTLPVHPDLELTVRPLALTGGQTLFPCQCTNSSSVLDETKFYNHYPYSNKSSSLRREKTRVWYTVRIIYVEE